MGWSSELEKIAPVVVALVVGFGIALYIGGTFYNALPANSIASTAVESILSAVSDTITTLMAPIFTIVFLVVLYMVVQKSGLMGRQKKE